MGALRWLLAVCLLNATGTVRAEPSVPSLELLEYLADLEAVDGRWVGPDDLVDGRWQVSAQDQEKATGCEREEVQTQ